MALRPVTHSHPCRNYPPVMVMDFLRILPGSAKDLNSHRESALAIPLRPAARFFSDQAVSARRRDSVMGRAAPAAAVYRASPNSADPFDSRDSVPGFADSVAADYSSPAVDLASVDLASVDLGSVAGRFVIAVAAAADPVAGLSFDPSCFADFSAALAVVAPDVSSVSRSFF